jgi:signal transduction histidine kinase
LLVTGSVTISLRYGIYFSLPVFAGAIIGFVANLVLLRLMFINAQKHTLEVRLNDLEHIRELERTRFESIEAKQYELAKIRHDFNNQLVTAYRLAEQNKPGEAAGMLDALSAALAETQEKTYCANHVVNIILTEKQITCENTGITLDTNVTLDEGCAIAPLHLCSVFSNLLDNAINECREVPNSVITITALQKGDYIHIKCVNPIKKEVKGGRGYGTRILADITGIYEGAYNAETIGGQYCAVISLLNAGQEL